MKREKLQNEERTFFSLLLSSFQNQWNLFWAYQNRNFLLGKSILHWEKIRQNDFAPPEKYSSYAPDWSHCLVECKWTRVLHGLKVCRFESKWSNTYWTILMHLWLWASRTGVKGKLSGLFIHSCTLRTLRACCSQSEFRMLKIGENRACALFLYKCTPNILRSADGSMSIT